MKKLSKHEVTSVVGGSCKTMWVWNYRNDNKCHKVFVCEDKHGNKTAPTEDWGVFPDSNCR